MQNFIFSLLERETSRVQGIFAGKCAACTLQECISCLLICFSGEVAALMLQ